MPSAAKSLSEWVGLKMHLFNCKRVLYSKIITNINNFVGHKNWVGTCDVRIQLYWDLFLDSFKCVLNKNLV